MNSKPLYGSFRPGASRWLLLLGILCAPFGLLFAQMDFGLPSKGIKFDKTSLKNLDAAADHYEYVGDNLIARGHVVIRNNQMFITADEVVVNLKTFDLEAAGNVSFSMRRRGVSTVSLEEYERLLEDPLAQVEFRRYVTDNTGKQAVEVMIVTNAMELHAERAGGNLNTGTFEFKNFHLKAGQFYAAGEAALRAYDGKITVRNARLTTCEYIDDDKEHYSVFTKHAVVSPHQAGSSLFDYQIDEGDHSVLATNTFFEVFGVPVFWFPVLYKPNDVSAFGFQFEFGNNSQWGYYIRSAKNFRILDAPYLNTNLMFDYYTKRGFGYGVNADLLTPESKTSVFYYGISDRDGFAYWNNGGNSDEARWKSNTSRFDIPTYRYEFRLEHLSHLTPRIDFRAQIDVLSDFNFLNDYFEDRYRRELEPPTFAAIDYQHERFTASMSVAFRVNDFFSSVERLPSFRLDFQRQELFANLYYQSESSFDNLFMRWRKFDNDDYLAGSLFTKPKDYSSFRFDTLHMFYYPFKLANINFIPRAGFRLTAYSRTSEQRVSGEDISRMIASDSLDANAAFLFNNYDTRGGSKVRFAGELGLEINTKFYRSWQNVKSAYWGLDGLRHVFIPYVNYTFIPKTTLDIDHILYFDEIDRITKNHFVRLGMVNRLQTRRGDSIYEWFSLENYWDLYLEKQDGFNNVGDFGTILRFTPFDGLSLSSELLIDAGGNNKHNAEAYRAGRPAGRPGISGKLINRWYTELSWTFAPKWRIYGSYYYSDAYVQRTPYSMGSMFTVINSSSSFNTPYGRNQYLSGGLEFPLLFDKHLSGRIQASYDVEEALLNNISFALMRRFHCWSILGEVGRTYRRESWSGGKEHSNYFAVALALTALPETTIRQRFSP